MMAAAIRVESPTGPPPKSSIDGASSLRFRFVESVLVDLEQRKGGVGTAIVIEPLCGNSGRVAGRGAAAGSRFATECPWPAARFRSRRLVYGEIQVRADRRTIFSRSAAVYETRADGVITEARPKRRRSGARVRVVAADEP